MELLGTIYSSIDKHAQESVGRVPTRENDRVRYSKPVSTAKKEKRNVLAASCITVRVNIADDSVVLLGRPRVNLWGQVQQKKVIFIDTSRCRLDISTACFQM